MTDMPHETDMDRAKEIADAMLPRPMIRYEVACSACGKMREGEAPATVNGGTYSGDISVGECCPGATMNVLGWWFVEVQMGALLHEEPARLPLVNTSLWSPEEIESACAYGVCESCGGPRHAERAVTEQDGHTEERYELACMRCHKIAE
jgi:hypothetical protein